MWCDDHRSVSVSFEMLLFASLLHPFSSSLRKLSLIDFFVCVSVRVCVCSYPSRDKWFFWWNVENTDLINERKLFVYALRYAQLCKFRLYQSADFVFRDGRGSERHSNTILNNLATFEQRLRRSNNEVCFTTSFVTHFIVKKFTCSWKWVKSVK